MFEQLLDNLGALSNNRPTGHMDPLRIHWEMQRYSPSRCAPWVYGNLPFQKLRPIWSPPNYADLEGLNRWGNPHFQIITGGGGKNRLVVVYLFFQRMVFRVPSIQYENLCSPPFGMIEGQCSLGNLKESIFSRLSAAHFKLAAPKLQHRCKRTSTSFHELQSDFFYRFARGSKSPAILGFCNLLSLYYQWVLLLRTIIIVVLFIMFGNNHHNYYISV